MDQIFLYQQWLHQRLHEYATSSRPPKLREREIVLSTGQYGAALMQAYLGKASLTWIAAHTGIPVERLRQYRLEPQFLLVMDWSKSIFSKTFLEKLALNDYSVAQHYYIAAEMSLLEESLRVAVRVPLYKRFKKIGRSLISRHQNDIPLPNYDLRLFRRFFLFFIALEYHWPSAAKQRLKEDFIPLAKDVVWPLLDEELWVRPELESMQQAVPLPQVRLVLDSKLSDTLKRFL